MALIVNHLKETQIQYIRGFKSVVNYLRMKLYDCVSNYIAHWMQKNKPNYMYRICLIRGRFQIVASFANKMKHLVAALK